MSCEQEYKWVTNETWFGSFGSDALHVTSFLNRNYTELQLFMDNMNYLNLSENIKRLTMKKLAGRHSLFE
jgi:hypothetical protein